MHCVPIANLRRDAEMELRLGITANANRRHGTRMERLLRLAVVFSLFLPACASPLRSGRADDAAATARAAELCALNERTPISLLHPWQGNVEREVARCLLVELDRGQFVRLGLEMDAGTYEYAGFGVQVYQPGDSAVMLQLFMSNAVATRRSISWEAHAKGTYYVRLWAPFGRPNVTRVATRAWIESLESPVQLSARRADLARDQRVRWLRDNAIAVRTITPEDTNFSDLEPLREALTGVRIVLLGEVDHASGSDFLAKTRLIKYLHQELDFDALAFEAGFYGMALAWDSIRAGEALRGVGCRVRQPSDFRPDTNWPQCLRDYQMGQHLLSLANVRYRGRKIIAWAATAHIMRNPSYLLTAGGSMGRVVRDALGDESYAIGMTAYQGLGAVTVIVDQHPLAEFEELMAAAGLGAAIVDLRRGARQGNWVAGNFFARPDFHQTVERSWSRELDALFFVRVEEQSKPVRNR